jgi:hypothetical protein
MLWELVFMLVVLKIPVVYLCAVVWWAIKAEPEPLQGVPLRTSPERPPDCDWHRRLRVRPRGPRGGRGGRPLGTGRVASARLQAHRTVRA